MNLPIVTVLRVVQLAQESHASEPPPPPTSEPVNLDANVTPDGNPAKLGLFNFVRHLPPDQQYELTAVALLGRGDFADFKSALKHIRSFPAEGTTAYITAKWPLDKYLISGLLKLH